MSDNFELVGVLY